MHVSLMIFMLLLAQLVCCNAEFSEYSTAMTMASTEESTNVTVSERVSTESKTTLPVIEFIVPSPSLLIVTLRERHIYYCQHSQTNRISWLLNGSKILSYLDLPRGISIGRGTLVIEGYFELNATTIQCIANLNGISIETPIVTFLIQGPLQRVTNLIRNGGTLIWKPPFSLDLTDVDPDIVYCVEVYHITCGRRDLIIGDCNVTEPSYTSDGIAQHGYIFEYTVTPRSNVKGASNGTSLTVIDKAEMQTLPTRCSSIANINVIGPIVGSTCTITVTVVVLVIIVTCVIYKVKKVKHASESFSMAFDKSVTIKSHAYARSTCGYWAMFLCWVVPGRKYKVKYNKVTMQGPPNGFHSVYDQHLIMAIWKMTIELVL